MTDTPPCLTDDDEPAVDDHGQFTVAGFVRLAEIYLQQSKDYRTKNPAAARRRLRQAASLLNAAAEIEET